MQGAGDSGPSSGAAGALGHSGAVVGEVVGGRGGGVVAVEVVVVVVVRRYH